MANRRVPQQKRSQERFNAIVDAAADLIDEGGAGSLTAAAIATRASVSTGAFYAYFDDRDAVVDALVDRYLRGFVEIVRSTFAHTDFDDLATASDALIDAFVDYHRQEPGLRDVWHGGALQPHHHQADQHNDHDLVAVNAELLVQAELVNAVTDELLDHLHVNWRIGDALINDAFRRHPDGDPWIINEAKHTIRLRLEAPSRATDPRSSPPVPPEGPAASRR